MGLSTHILDTALGKPAANVTVRLSQHVDDAWKEIGSGQTDAGGRCSALLGERSLEVATYSLHFETASYYAAQGVRGLYPHVEIVFVVSDATQHHHIPLLLTANGYTTYRGS